MSVDRTGRPGRGLPMRYLLIVWLMAMGAIAYMDRTNIAIAGIQLGREFKIDDTQLGWVFSAFLIGYAAFQIPGGVLARRLRARRGRPGRRPRPPARPAASHGGGCGSSHLVA